jgi:hypothetical protein
MNEITEVIHLEICATLGIQQLSTKHIHPSTLKTERFLDAIHIAEVSDCFFYCSPLVQEQNDFGMYMKEVI